jgi:hypothetical protein
VALKGAIRMSYDIQLVIVGPAESVREVAQRDQIGEVPYTSEAIARNSTIAAALIEVFPEFNRCEFDGHVELTDLKGGTGIQVCLFADSGAISVPYWHGDAASAVLAKIDHVLRIVLSNGPFLAFDPQTGQQLKPGTLLSTAAPVVYSAGTAAVRRVAGREPWWRFWK